MPVTVIGPPVCALDSATPVTSENANVSGVMSRASVVLVNVSDTPPTVSMVLVAAEKPAAAVWQTFIESPSTTVPLVWSQAPPLMLAMPPTTSKSAEASIPLMLTALLSCGEPRSTSPTSMKVKMFGVVSTSGTVGSTVTM